MEKLREDLVKELEEMKKLGMKVSDQTMTQAHTADLEDYEMDVTELASLFCELYN